MYVTEVGIGTEVGVWGLDKCKLVGVGTRIDVRGWG